jgi:uncharacterized protein
MARDRDETGRARNTRPRDAYGRPLPHDAEGEERVPDDYAAPPEEALAEAQRLLDADRPFHAHEVLEAAWKTGPPGERELWQGLAQIAVGLTHARRGNARGAITLLRRGVQRIQAYQGHPAGPLDPGTTADAGAPGGPGPSGREPHPYGLDIHPYGMDVPALVAAAEGLATRIEEHGLDRIPPADLSPRLLTGAM